MSNLASSLLYYAVPSDGCSGYSIALIRLFYELAQWWWSKLTKYLKDETGIREIIYDINKGPPVW